MVSEKIIRNPEDNCEVLVSREEEKYRKKFPSFEEIKTKQLKCTVCSVNLTPFIVAAKSCHLHAFLKVLVCKKCLDFYGSGDFSTDEDGDEKYCRWCGQGGNLFLCDKCNSGFCKACIKRNFNRDEFEELKGQDKWDCYMCNPEPLYELRAKAWAAEKFYLSHRKEDKKSNRNSTHDKDEPKISKSRPKVDKQINSEQKFIVAARKILLEALDDSKCLADECKKKAEKLQKTKVTKKNLKNVKDITEMEGKIQIFFGSITENVETIKSDLTKNLATLQQCYDDVFKSEVNGKDNIVDDDEKPKEEENGCNESGDAKEEKADTGKERKDEEKEEDDETDVTLNGSVVKEKGDGVDSKDVVKNDDDDDGENDVDKEEKEEEDSEMDTSLNETAATKRKSEGKRMDEEDVSETEADEDNLQDDKNTTMCSSKANDSTVISDSDSDEPPAKSRKT